jgi:hypothetical protein
LPWTNGLAYFAAAKKKVLLDPVQMESLHVLIPSLSRDADLGLMQQNFLQLKFQTAVN